MATRRARCPSSSRSMRWRPTDPSVIGGLARALLAAGQRDEAQAILEAAPAEASTHAEIGRARAALELAEAAPDTDTSDLESRIASNPDDFEARYELAGAKMAAGDRDAAADTLLDLISPRPRLERGRCPEAPAATDRGAGPGRPVGALAEAAALRIAVHMSGKSPAAGCRSSRFPEQSSSLVRSCLCTFSSRVIGRWSATLSTGRGGSG